MAQALRTIIPLSIALAVCLAGCGGGGGGSGVGSTPPPPPAPPPPPPPPPPAFPSIVGAATSSQEFAVKGASYTTPIATYDELTVSSPSLADGAQLDVRYNATTNIYEIQLPADPQWQALAPQASYPPPNQDLFLYRAPATDHVGVFDHRSDLQYSAVLEWFTDTTSGFSAIGIATSPGGVPLTGSASYSGAILGASSETSLNPWEAVWMPGQIRGSIDLSFNFGSGTLSGSISPILNLDQVYTLPSLSFANTVYSSGSTTFSGAFATNVGGQNSFSGLFTGPAAQELIGSFAFPYASPVDGATEQAAGAFAASKP